MGNSILPLFARLAGGDGLAPVKKQDAVCDCANVVSPRCCAAPASSLSTLMQCLRQIGDAGVDAAELRRVRLRHVDAELLMQRDEEIEEIHGIDVELVAQALGRLEIARIQLGHDPGQGLDHANADVVFSHKSSGCCSRRSTAARKSAPRWPSVAR